MLQEAGAADPGTAREQPPGSRQQAIAHRPWAWEIQTGSTKIWIVGCLHLGTPRDALAFPAYLPIYRRASVVYFETIPGSSGSYDNKRLVGHRGYLSDRQLLSSRISSETWQKLTLTLSSDPARLAAVSRMEPWLAAITLIQDGYAKASLDRENSLETFLRKQAIRDRKPIGAMETSKDQILAMADIPISDQEVFLKDTLNGLENIDAETQALRDAWMSGNQSLLQTALGFDSAVSRSGMHQSLIGQRNQRWIDKIKEIGERRKDAVIVVGVEHLVSTSSALPELLDKAGFAIRRIAPNAK